MVLGDFNATIWDPYFDRVKRKGSLHSKRFCFHPRPEWGCGQAFRSSALPLTTF